MIFVLSSEKCSLIYRRRDLNLMNEFQANMSTFFLFVTKFFLLCSGLNVNFPTDKFHN